MSALLVLYVRYTRKVDANCGSPMEVHCASSYNISAIDSNWEHHRQDLTILELPNIYIQDGALPLNASTISNILQRKCLQKSLACLVTTAKEETSFNNGVLIRVRAMHGIFANARSELCTNASFCSFCWICSPNEGSKKLYCVIFSKIAA